MSARPTILSIAGHDPTGGAGITADVETINELGGHACSIITANTVQNSENLHSFEPVSTQLLHRQFLCLVEDFDIKVIKIGLIGSHETLQTLIKLLSQTRDIPVILDPILAAGGGTPVSNQAFIEALSTGLLPYVSLITPNIPEAKKLTNLTNPDDSAQVLMALGCENVLITGTHADSEQVVHRLYSKEFGKLTIQTPRLPETYHGSGCTLSSAISFYLASGHSITNAVKLAQEFTYASLANADKPGHFQSFPVRNAKLWQ